MKTIFVKKMILSIIFFLLCGYLYAVPEKLGMIKPFHHGYFRSLLFHNNYVLALTVSGDLCIYSVENDTYNLEKTYHFNFYTTSPDSTMACYQDYIYIRTAEKILIFKISSLPEVEFINSYPIEGEFRFSYSTKVHNNILIIGGSYSSSILFLSLEDPENPVEISRINGSFSYGTYQIMIFQDILITGTYLQGIVLWDISDIESPVIIKEMAFSKLYSIFLSNNGFLLINNYGNILILDIRDKNNIGEPFDTGQTLNFRGGINLENNIVLFAGSAFYFVNKSHLENPSSINWDNRADNYFYCQCYDYIDQGNGNGKFYVIDDKSHKAILSISDLNQTINFVGETNLEDHTNYGEIALIDNYLYTSHTGEGISIYRINQDGNLTFIKNDRISNSLYTSRGVRKIEIPDGNQQKTYLVAYDIQKAFFIDITNRENPSLVSISYAKTNTFEINYPYMYTYSLYGELNIVDISDIENPQTIYTLPLPDRPNTTMHYYNNHVYIGKYIIDVSNSTNPLIVKDDFDASYVAGKDNILVAWTGNQSSVLKVFDITDPENPQEIQKILLTTTEGNYQVQSAKKLFFKGDKLVCSFRINKTFLPQTVFYSLQGQSLIPEYIVDGLVSGFEQKDNYLYIAQEEGTPLGMFGKSYIIPHIATTWGWETKLIADNYGESDISFSYILKDGINIERKGVTIGAGKQMAIDLSEGQSGEVIVPFNSKLSFKVSYHHTGENGIAEFLLDSHITRNPILFTPQYLSDHLTWMGVALSNCEGTNGDTTITALNSSGEAIDNQQILIDPMTRFASVLTNLFTGTDFRDISAVKTQSNSYLSGITISGNGNSQLLFTPATYSKSRTNTRYIPHIDVKGYWDTYLILDNPTDSDITVNLTFYSNGNIAANESKTIIAHSSLPVLINDYNNSEIDCGEIKNCTPDLIVRLAYMFKSTGATAEFLIDGDNLSSKLVFNLPAYRSNVLTWWGIAIMNPEDNGKDITLKAYSNGQEIDSATIHIEGHTKMADLIENIFQNLNGETVERVIAQTPSGNISGLNICGSNQDRYLFTPAIPY